MLEDYWKISFLILRCFKLNILLLDINFDKLAPMQKSKIDPDRVQLSLKEFAYLCCGAQVIKQAYGYQNSKMLTAVQSKMGLAILNFRFARITIHKQERIWDKDLCA